MSKGPSFLFAIERSSRQRVVKIEIVHCIYKIYKRFYIFQRGSEVLKLQFFKLLSMLTSPEVFSEPTQISEMKTISYFCKKIYLTFLCSDICVLMFRGFTKSQWRCSVGKGALRNFAKFTGKHLCQSLFLIKLQTLACNFIKIRFWHRCFPVNLVKFLRTTL